MLRPQTSESGGIPPVAQHGSTTCGAFPYIFALLSPDPLYYSTSHHLSDITILEPLPTNSVAGDGLEQTLVIAGANLNFWCPDLRHDSAIAPVEFHAPDIRQHQLDMCSVREFQTSNMFKKDRRRAASSPFSRILHNYSAYLFFHLPSDPLLASPASNWKGLLLDCTRRAQPWPPCDGSARYTAAAPGPQGSNYGGWKINITKQEISNNKRYNEFTVRKCCIEGMETSGNALHWKSTDSNACKYTTAIVVDPIRIRKVL